MRYLGEKSGKVGLERWKRWVAGERRKEDRGRRGVHLAPHALQPRDRVHVVVMGAQQAVV